MGDGPVLAARVAVLGVEFEGCAWYAESNLVGQVVGYNGTENGVPNGQERWSGDENSEKNECLGSKDNKLERRRRCTARHVQVAGVAGYFREQRDGRRRVRCAANLRGRAWCEYVGGKGERKYINTPLAPGRGECD